MPTKGLLVEQCIRRINGGNPSAARAFKDEDVAILIGQVINAKLKADYVTTTLASGETIPEGATMVTYDEETALSVEKYGECFSVCRLPLMPIKLPRDLGLFHVSRVGDYSNPFIPTHPGDMALYTKMKVVNDLLGQIGYHQEGLKIVFDQDLTAQNINKVMVKLMVHDILSLGEFDLLPITPEMEFDVVETVYQKLVNKPPQDKVNDTTTTPTTP